MKIYNADKLSRPDKEISVNGKLYKIPSSLSVRMIARMAHLGQEMKKNPENTDLLIQSVDLLIELFRIRQPELKSEDFDITMDQYIEIQSAINDNGDEDGDLGKA